MDPHPPDAPQHPLHVEVSGTGPRLVLAHGFTQTGRLWGPFGEILARRRQLVRVDLPGHGGSSGVRADLPRSAELLADAGGPGPFDLLGYSLGARVALHTALARPDLVRRLVLVGGTAGIEQSGDRQRRRERDEALADDLEADGLDAFLARWLAAPMFAGLDTPGLEERRRNTTAGLAASLRSAGTGTQEPLWDRLGSVAAPVLVLAGASDIRFARAGERLVRGLPAGILSLVPGAGHAAHLEQPELAARLVAHFLAAVPPAAGVSAAVPPAAGAAAAVPPAAGAP